jgi:hypothetical protein
MFPTLHKNGFLQFGLPHEGNYDPVCFDMKRRNRADAQRRQLITRISHPELYSAQDEVHPLALGECEGIGELESRDPLEESLTHERSSRSAAFSLQH